MQPTTYVKIDLSRLRYNIKEYIKLLGDTTKIIAVLKAQGYGHGMIKIAETALEEGAAMIGVARVNEGVTLRNAGIKETILVLGGTLPREITTACESNLVLAVYSIEQLEELNAVSKSMGKEHKFHLKIETGMNRLGIRAGQDLEEFLNVLEHMDNVRLSGVYSHYATSDDIDSNYTKQQFQVFTEAMRQIRRREYMPKTHISNSAAISSYEFSRLDYVRLGIGMYGLKPDDRDKIDLKPVMSLHSSIVQIKRLYKGDTISYGRTYTAENDIKVGVVPIGYGDGYPRLMSNKGDVLVNGKRCRVIGTVCMDHIMIDVTSVKDVHIGDDVVLLGEQDDQEITAEEIAEICSTIHYEIVTGIQERVERIYVDQG